MYVSLSQVIITTNSLIPSSLIAVANGTLTLRERDSTDQLIGKIDDVIAVTVALSNSQMKWAEACEKLEKYSGTQEIE